MKDKIKFWLAVVLLVASITSISVAWERYRWHTFQEVTDSDVSYWKWKFVIEKSVGVSGGKGK